MNERLIKSYLRRYIRAENVHSRICEDYKELCESLSAIGGFKYGQLRVQQSLIKSAKFEDLIARKEFLEQKMLRAGVNAYDIKEELRAMIWQLNDDRSRWILLSLYIEKTSWQDLFDHGAVSEATYYRWHRKALYDFAEMYAGEIEKWHERSM